MRIPKNYLKLLSYHRNCTQVLLEFAEDLDRDQIEVSNDERIKKINKMIRSVTREIHKLKSFIRLKPKGENIRYSRIEPEHDIGQNLSDFFAKRFPPIIIVLGNGKISWISLFADNDLHRCQAEGLNSSLKRFDKILNDKNDIEDIENLWNEYYWTQYAPERKNEKLYRKNMPKKYMKSANIKEKKKNVSLEQFSSD